MMPRPNLNPAQYYAEGTLRILGIDGDTLKHAREDGRLPFRMLGDTVLYVGADVLEWLKTAELYIHRRPPRHGDD
jgi:hypothetical protein